MDQRSPVHEIVNALWRALHELGSPAETDRHRALGLLDPRRAVGAGPRVPQPRSRDRPREARRSARGDRGALPRRGVHPGRPGPAALDARRAGPRARRSNDGWRVLPAAGARRRRDVLAVFGRKVGDLVTPTTGLNELASALVASIQLEQALDREPAHRDRGMHRADDPVPRRSGHRAARSARGARPARRALDAVLARAVRVGNRDVENFADNEPARVPRQHVEAAAREQPRAPLAARLHGSRLPHRAAEDGELPRAAARRARVPRVERRAAAARSTRAASRARPATSSSRCATCARSCTRSRSSRRSPT